MSTVNPVETIEYPESDGQPMGETDTHRKWMIRILQWLEQRYRDQHVYIASDLLLYYEEGQPTKFLVPDDFIVLNSDPKERRIFKTWVEKRGPDVVFEVTSKSTSRVDLVTKPVIYERIGVKEYYLYDPTVEYLDPPLRGFRLIDGVYHEISFQDGEMLCETLGVTLRLHGDNLAMYDTVTGERLLTEADAYRLEAERLQREAERQQRDAEQRRQEAAAESTARRVAEARIAELEAELERIRGNR